MSHPTGADHDGEPPLVLVVDFGAQYAQLIARRVREARVYSEIVPHTMPSPSSWRASRRRSSSPAAPRACTPTARRASTRALFDAGVPVFGICYGFQAMAEALGGTVKRTEGAEFGRTTATVEPDAVLFVGIPCDQPVWMSHRDAVVVAPRASR